MLIQAIRQSSPGRLTVCLEDGSEIKSSLTVVTDMRLYSGRALEDSELETLRLESRKTLARERALDWVSRRRMSCKELKTKLLQKGEDESVADYCVGWLTDNGFLSDESYSFAVARHYAAKGYGEGRVRAELQRRGVSRELWEDAFTAMPDNGETLDRLVAAKLRDPEDRDQVRKLSQLLFRRGYSWEDIRAALRRFQAETELED